MGSNPLQCFEAAHAGHGDIHDQYVGRQLVIPLAGGFARFGFSHDHDFHVRLQKQPESGADHRVIVNEQDANHVPTAVGIFALNKGISAVRLTPWGARLRMLSWPPRCSTRSVKPRRPKWPGRDQLPGAGRPTPSSVTVTNMRCGAPAVALIGASPKRLSRLISM